MHNKFMQLALLEAQKAVTLNEIPVGAIIVKDHQVIAGAHNMTETYNDFSAHAELLALRRATRHIGNKYLTECSIYVTLEPCPMCMHAIKLARIDKIYYGAIADKKITNTPEIYDNIMQRECSELLRRFFNDKRNA